MKPIKLSPTAEVVFFFAAMFAVGASVKACEEDPVPDKAKEATAAYFESVQKECDAGVFKCALWSDLPKGSCDQLLGDDPSAKWLCIAEEVPAKTH